MIQYKYPKKQINDEQLRKESGLKHLGNKTINDEMFIVFKKELNTQEKKKLDIIIKNHKAIIPVRESYKTHIDLWNKLNDIIKILEAK